MISDLVEEMPKLNRHLRPHPDTASKTTWKFNTKSTKSSHRQHGVDRQTNLAGKKLGTRSGSLHGSSETVHQQVAQERRERARFLSNTGAKPGFGEGGTNTLL